MPCREEQRLRLQLDQLTLQVGHWLVGNLEGVKNFEGKPMNDTRRLNEKGLAASFSLSHVPLKSKCEKERYWRPRRFWCCFSYTTFWKSFSSVFTLPEINKAPENRPSPKQISSSNHWFSGDMLVSKRVFLVSRVSFVSNFCFMVSRVSWSSYDTWSSIKVTMFWSGRKIPRESWGKSTGQSTNRKEQRGDLKTQCQWPQQRQLCRCVSFFAHSSDLNQSGNFWGKSAA